ncbi:MAG: aquaporin [Thermoplasmata archaeon]|nr:aquaporin [Thermoplasmata archaeon]MCI4359123.1 aquaporin [Thermoplasmata archaeon]
MAWSAGQRYLVEFVGTFSLLLAVGGAAVFTLDLGAGSLVRVVLVSLSVGFGLIGLLYSFGEISGGHFNPAVTIGAWAAGRFAPRDVLPYLAAQVAGGIAGMGTIAAVAYGNPDLFHAAQGSALASQCYTTGAVACGGFGWGAVFVLETAFTFFLVLVILFATRSDASAKNLAPIGIGLTLIMTNLVGIPVDGASINPARSFAPALLSAFWSSGNWAIQQDWIFWVAPILGGVIAALVDRALQPARP